MTADATEPKEPDSPAPVSPPDSPALKPAVETKAGLPMAASDADVDADHADAEKYEGMICRPCDKPEDDSAVPIEKMMADLAATQTIFEEATFRQPPNGVMTYQLCRYYKSHEGTCQYGSSCSFAHGQEELSAWGNLQAHDGDQYMLEMDTEESANVPIRERPGGISRPFVLCRLFRTPGGCPKGDECVHPHSVIELEAWNTSTTPSPPTHRAGTTIVIDPSAPPRPPPNNVLCTFQLCKYLSSGVCPRGLACPFAHSDTELRRWSQSRRKERQLRAKTIMTESDSSDDGQNKAEGEVMEIRPPPVGLTMMPQMCSFFAASHCDKGFYCTFAHSAEELRSWELARQEGRIVHDSDGSSGSGAAVITRRRHNGQSQPEPRPFPSGFVGKIQMCTHFKSGRCVKGEMCTFAHSELERQMWETEQANRMATYHQPYHQPAGPQGYMPQNYMPPPSTPPNVQQIHQQHMQFMYMAQQQMVQQQMAQQHMAQQHMMPLVAPMMPPPQPYTAYTAVAAAAPAQAETA
eukprot:COSAG04_NODE_1285_length_7373_cov_52.336954_2_plen_521_part_00